MWSDHIINLTPYFRTPVVLAVESIHLQRWTTELDHRQ